MPKSGLGIPKAEHEDWPVVRGEGKGGSAERDESSASRPRHEMLSETLDEETFPRGS
ncbi:hypothetical protein E4U32_001147 [Claviceps aff. humidiphila group G2b]|nr:hypothetical protein E4U32_001147 [Claviceps aff. humidiphila group G2b]